MGYLIKREFSAFFSTPFGYVFMGIFLVLSGVSFTTFNLLGGGGDLAGTFSLLSNMSFIVFPVLTMRLYADDRKTGTEHLLFSSRLHVWQIILGKYIAVFLVFLCTLAITLIYLGIIARFGSPNYGAALASYLGYILLSMAMIATCMFFASLAESQVTAAVLSFGALFALVMFGPLARTLQIPIVRDVFRALAITQPYDEITRGIFRLGPVSYYLAFTAIMLFATVKALEWRRLRG